MKIYFYITGLVLTICLFFGIVIPSLVSMTDTIAVIFGGVLVIVLIPTLFYLIKGIIKTCLKGEN